LIFGLCREIIGKDDYFNNYYENYLRNKLATMLLPNISIKCSNMKIKNKEIVLS